MFRRYELTLERFLATFPEPFTLSPSNFAPATVCSQIRMAVNAVLTHGYNTTLDVSRLREVWPQVQVLLRGTRVTIGTREAQKFADVQFVADSVSGSKNLLTVNNPSNSDLISLFSLFASHAFTDPVRLTGTIPSFLPPPGHYMMPQDDKSFLIL